ncbi:MAG: hypothetical protein R2762_16610 [Bryobacteraceae bacterium]
MHRPHFLGAIWLLYAGAAAAQPPLNCTAQAAGTPQIRSEGVSELVGDILIICSSGSPAGPVEQLRLLDILVTTSSSIDITGRIGPDGQLTEALAFFDEPMPSLQHPCGSPSAPYSIPPGSGSLLPGVCGAHAGSPSGNGIGAYDPSINAPILTVGATTYQTHRANAFQARRLTSNTIVWKSVPFDDPGILSTRIIRLTNLRVNASQLGVPLGQQAVVQTIITAIPSTGGPVPVTNNAPTVAIAQPGVSFAVVDKPTCLQSNPANAAFAASAVNPLTALGSRCDGRAALLRFEEYFPSAFKRRAWDPSQAIDVPGQPTSQDVLGYPFFTESGIFKAATSSFWPATLQNGQPAAGTAPGTLGLADSATRLVVRFQNIQNGVAVWLGTSVPIYTSASPAVRTGTARLVQTDANGAGEFNVISPGASPANFRTVSSVTPIPPGYDNDGLHRLTVSAGAGYAVYELVHADTTQLERVDIPVVFAYASNPGANLPSFGTATVSGALGPASAIASASATAPLPRFVDSGAAAPVLTITSAGMPSPRPPSPTSGAGLAQTFTFQFDDADGAGDLSVLNVLINNAIDGRQSCYIAYVPSGPGTGTMFLVNDAGDAGGPFAGALAIPSTASIGNSQCQIHGTGSSASFSGARLALALNVTFAGTYAGRRIVYQAARDRAGNNSGWVAKGVWTVPGAAPTSPRVDASTPPRTEASTFTLTTTFTDDDGFADLGVLNILVNNAVDGRQACYAAFVRSANTLVLVNDAGDAGGPFAGSIAIPGGSNASNSQCRIDASGSVVGSAGKSIFLTLRFTFFAPFRGDRIVYAAARDTVENSSGWQAIGTVTVP